MAGLALLGLLASVLWYLTQDDTRVVRPGSSPAASPSPTTPARADGASRLLRDLADALNAGSRAEVLALAAPGEATARRALRTIHDNVRDLGVEGITLRYVDGDAGRTSAADRRTFGADAWVADVDLGWGLRDQPSGIGTMEVALTLVDTPEGLAFAAAGGYEAPAPLWLLADLAVAESRRSLVAVANPAELDRYAGLADRAVREVREVIPRWRGRLVVQVPTGVDQLHQLLDAEDGTYDAIAAVTATVDGSVDPSAPVHILVNPEVFEKIGAEGSQIVMSHEATHVAMRAAVSTMPLWLLEGFADYVALARSDLPVSVTASQILADVRRSGPPRSLPGPDEFDPSNKLLGSSYEAAWLACRLLAEQHGEARLIDFYTAVDEGTPVTDAFAELGTTEQAFTRAWRGYLQELAG